jgi:hypothetical protein
MMEVLAKLQAAGSVIAAMAYRFTDEAELQEGISQALASAGIGFEREVVLSPRDRIDFMLEYGVGIEVKIDGSISALTRQVFRYTELPVVSAVLVVVALNRLGQLPHEMNGKPVLVLGIQRAFQ